MARAPRPIKSDTALIEAVLRITPEKNCIACLEAPVIRRFALVLTCRTISQSWADLAFSLQGKRYDYGDWNNQKMVWLFPSSAIPELIDKTPSLKVAGYSPQAKLETAAA
jgi:hypothetical protein